MLLSYAFSSSTDTEEPVVTTCSTLIDGQTDRQTDRQTDGQTDSIYCNTRRAEVIMTNYRLTSPVPPPVGLLLISSTRVPSLLDVSPAWTHTYQLRRTDPVTVVYTTH